MRRLSIKKRRDESSAFANAAVHLLEPRLGTRHYAITNVDALGVIEPFTFASVAHEAAAWAHLLREEGLQPGDRVVVLAGREWEWRCALLGVIRAGGVAVPCPASLPVEEVRAIAASAGAARLVSIPERPDLVEIEGSPVRDAGELDRVDASRAVHEPPYESKQSDVALILYARRPTGLRGAMHTHASLIAQAEAGEHWLGAGEDEPIWCTAVDGSAESIWLMLAAWQRGANVVNVEVELGDEDSLELLARLGAGVVWFSDDEYRRLAPAAAAWSVRESIHRALVSDDRPSGAIAFANAVGAKVAGLFAVEELGVVAGWPAESEGDAATETARLIPGIQLEIVQDQGIKLPTGEVGDVVVRVDAPSLVAGYAAPENKTQGWFRVGWRGALEPDGSLRLASRSPVELEPVEAPMEAEERRRRDDEHRRAEEEAKRVEREATERKQAEAAARAERRAARAEKRRRAERPTRVADRTGHRWDHERRAGPKRWGPETVPMTGGIAVMAPSMTAMNFAAIYVALLSGWLVARGGASSALVVCVAALVILAVVAMWNPGVSVGLLVLAVMNGIPGINLEPHSLAGYQVSDFAVAVLAGGLALRVHARGASAGPYTRRLSILAMALGAWWLIVLLRTTFNGVPLLKGFLFGRDFLYFAILLPLVAAGLRGRREVVGCIGTLFAGALLFSLGLLASSALGASLNGWARLFVHASSLNQTESGGINRVYSIMGDSLGPTVAFGLGLALIPPRKRFARRLGILLFVVGGIATLYLFTRALYIGTGVSLVGVMILWRFGGGSQNAARRVLGTLYAVLILLVVIINFAAVSHRVPALAAASSRTGLTITEFQHETGNVGYRYALDQKMLDVLGSSWIGGLGFLHPASHPVGGLPFGSIRNTDTGVMNSLMTMGAVGTALLYLAPVAILIAVIRRWRALTEPGEQRSLEWFLFGTTMWLIVVLVTSISLVTLFSVSGLAMSAALIGCAARLLDETRSRA